MSKEWLLRQVRARAVPFVPLGRSIRFTDEDITAIIENRKQAPVRRPGGQRTKL